METEATRRELGRLVRDRRKALRLTQVEVQKSGGPSTATLRLIEGGRAADLRASTIEPLEKVLQWEPGSVARILDGKLPAIAEVRQRLGDIQAAMQLHSGAAERRADAQIRAAGRLVEAASRALASNNHAGAIADLEDGIEVSKAAIEMIENIAIGEIHAQPTTSATNSPATSSGAPSTEDQEAGAGDGQLNADDLTAQDQDLDLDSPDDPQVRANPKVVAAQQREAARLKRIQERNKGGEVGQGG